MEEISCDTCVAACCKAPIAMTLTAKEFAQHRGTMDLRQELKPLDIVRHVNIGEPRQRIEVGAGLGVFMLESGCANLDADHRCTIYSKRPQCCRDFEMGSDLCLRARRKAGLDADRPLVDLIEHQRTVSEQLLEEFVPNASDSERFAAVMTARAPSVQRVGLAEARASVTQNATWIADRLERSDASMWSRRTRCAGWDVGALVAHLVTAQRFAHAMLAAAMQGKAATPPNDFRGSRAATMKAFTRAAGDLGDVLARIPEELVEKDVRIGDEEAVPVQHLIEVLTMELSVHGLDLAHALGDTRHLTSDAVRATTSALPDLLDAGPAPRHTTSYVLRSVAFELPFTWRGGTWRNEPGDEPCEIEGDVETVLLFALGREPFDEAKLRTNRPDAARAFKRHLVGP